MNNTKEIKELNKQLKDKKNKIKELKNTDIFKEYSKTLDEIDSLEDSIKKLADDVRIYETDIIDQLGEKKGKLAILFGGIKNQNPQSYMDEVLKEYISGSPYNEFIESHLDLPWIRIVIKGINEIPWDVYTTQKL